MGLSPRTRAATSCGTAVLYSESQKPPRVFKALVRASFTDVRGDTLGLSPKTSAVTLHGNTLLHRDSQEP
eukprot:14646901-Alexandrium_andersonii.AAC.1